MLKAQIEFNFSENFYTTKARILADTTLTQNNGFETPEAIRWINFWEPYVYPHGDFAIYFNTLQNQFQAQSEKNTNRQSSSMASGLKELGPTITPLRCFTCNAGDKGKGIGMVDFIVIDQSNTNNMLAGSGEGGLFYSEDGGDTWANAGTDQLSDDFHVNTGVSFAVIDPANNNNWLIAMGGSRNARGSFGNPQTLGIFRTTDKGSSWELIGDCNVFNTCYGDFITHLLIDPNNSNVVYAAATNGIYKTTNAWGANVVWTKVRSGDFYELQFKSDNSSGVLCNPCSTLYAGDAANKEIIYSNDFGQNWSPLPDVDFIPPYIKKIMPRTTKANPDYLYVILLAPVTCDDCTDKDNCTGCPPNIYSIYRFSISSQIWEFRYSFGKIRTGFAASPIDAELLLEGDISPVIKSTNGGASWINLNGNGYHNDIRYITFSPDGNAIWIGTDGGVNKSTDGGNNWTDQSSGLGVATFFNLGGSDANSNLVLTGAQDCGGNLFDASKLPNNPWKFIAFGDGNEQLIDYKNADYMYSSGNYGVDCSNDGGQNFFDCISGIRPMVFNTANPQTLYLGSDAKNGTIYRTDDRGSNLNIIGKFSGSHPNYYLWSIFTAPSNPDYLYVYLTPGGPPIPQYLYKTTNANDPNPQNVISSWVQVTQHPKINEGWIANIDVDDQDPEVFWISYSAPTSGGDVVYKYDGHTAQYTNISTNLPGNLWCGAVYHEKGSDDGLYLITSDGIYYTNNKYLDSYNNGCSNSNLPCGWIFISDGFPNVGISEMEINYAANKLRMATFGRGLWEMDLYCPPDDKLTLSGSAPNYFYEAKESITSTQTINSGTKTTYRAGDEIILTDGFVASEGSDFHAFIHPCNHSGNSFRKQSSQQENGNDIKSKENKNSASRNLIDNYPNPFDDHTHIEFDLKEKSKVTIVVYNVYGQEIKRLINNQEQLSGSHEIIFDASEFQDGIYICSFESRNEKGEIYKETKKLVKLK